MKLTLSLVSAILIASLAGCSTYPNGEPIEWGGMNKAAAELNQNMPMPASPRTTSCTRTATGANCTTY